MSEATRESTRQWCRQQTAAELRVEIRKAREARRWEGCEFDDARVRHKRQVRLETMELALERGDHRK
jgi:hypothetical protein